MVDFVVDFVVFVVFVVDFVVLVVDFVVVDVDFVDFGVVVGTALLHKSALQTQNTSVTLLAVSSLHSPSWMPPSSTLMQSLKTPFSSE